MGYLETQMAVYSSGIERVSENDAVDHMTDELLGTYDGSNYGTYSVTIRAHGVFKSLTVRLREPPGIN